MLLRGQQVEQHVMLGANPHVIPHLAHLLEQIVAENLRGACRPGQQTRQHGDSRGLPGAVVAEQREDLPVVHLQVDAVDGLEAVRVRFCQVSDLHILIVEL